MSTDNTPEGAPQVNDEGTEYNPPSTPLTANTNVPDATPEVEPELKANETVFNNPYANNVDNTASVSYIETSIKGLTTELGLSEDDFDAVTEAAIKHGDLSLINPHALGKQLTQAQADRVYQLAAAAVQETQQSVKRAQQTVYGIAGGEQQWNAAIGAFNSNASEDVRGYVGWLSENGKLSEAANYVLKHNQENHYQNQGTQAPLQGGNGQPEGTGLTKQQYSVEISKIEREAGNRSFGSPEFAGRIADLDKRRELGRSRGL